MRSVTLSLLAPLLFAACGISPASPTPAAAPSPVAVGLSLQIAYLGGANTGMGSPATVTVGARAVGEVSAGTLEGVSFRMSDAAGLTLAEARVDSHLVIPAGGSPEATVSQTLAWDIAKGYGRRVDVTVTVRDPSGTARTLSYWAPR